MLVPTGYCGSFRIPPLTSIMPQILSGTPHFSLPCGWLSVESAPLSLVPQKPPVMSLMGPLRGHPLLVLCPEPRWVRPGPAAPVQWAQGFGVRRQFVACSGSWGRKTLTICLPYPIPSFPSKAALLSQSCSRMTQRLFELPHEAFCPETQARVWEGHDLSIQVGCLYNCPSSLNLSHCPWFMDALTLLLNMNSFQDAFWFLMHMGSSALSHLCAYAT